MAKKIILGNVASSLKTIVRKEGEVEAGICVKMDTDGSVKAGHTYGVSLGSPLESGGGSAVAIAGVDIFIEQLTGSEFAGDIGDLVYIDSVTGKACKSDYATAQLVNATVTDMGAEAYSMNDLTGKTGKKTGVLVSMIGGL